MKKRTEPLDFAFRFLSYRDRAWSEIERRMRLKGYESAEIEEVRIKLDELKLINDGEFIKAYIENKRKRLWGPIRIKNELMKFGLHKSEIEKHCDTIDWQETFEKAIQFYREKFEVREKLVSKLQRQGFPSGWIWDSVRKLDF